MKRRRASEAPDASPRLPAPVLMPSHSWGKLMPENTGAPRTTTSSAVRAGAVLFPEAVRAARTWPLRAISPPRFKHSLSIAASASVLVALAT